MTAADVLFSLRRAFTYPGSQIAFVGPKIASLTAPNEHTVVIKLKSAWPYLLADLSGFNAAILPKRLIMKEGYAAFLKHPVGTRPFMWSSASPGVSITVVRNPNYWEARDAADPGFHPAPARRRPAAADTVLAICLRDPARASGLLVPVAPDYGRAGGSAAAHDAVPGDLRGSDRGRDRRIFQRAVAPAAARLQPRHRMPESHIHLASGMTRCCTCRRRPDQAMRRVRSAGSSSIAKGWAIRPEIPATSVVRLTYRPRFKEQATIVGLLSSSTRQ